MIDLHTHILCGVDDGAKTPEESLKMLQMEREQGVTTVVLTPHFYRDQQRPEHFFKSRASAMQTLQDHLATLPQEEQDSLPQILLGAEVAWRPNLAQWDDLDQFCIQGTRYMLLELPFGPWDVGLSNQLYDLMGRTDITPVLAHIDRYIGTQKGRQVEEILSMGLPVQVSSTAFLHMSTRNSVLKALKNGWAHIVATDCHNPNVRKPDLGQAMEVIEKKLGHRLVRFVNDFAAQLLEG